jgi:hypothetical protein
MMLPAVVGVDHHMSRVGVRGGRPSNTFTGEERG